MGGYPRGKSEIERVLPHRDPFLWLSRIVSCSPGESVVAELDIDPKLPLFKGHFPSYPVFPGVLIMEALAQAASYCLLSGRESEGAVGFFAAIDGAKFRSQVLPGDTVRLEARIIKAGKRLCTAETEAWVGDRLCAQATQKYVLGPA